MNAQLIHITMNNNLHRNRVYVDPVMSEVTGVCLVYSVPRIPTVKVVKFPIIVYNILNPRLEARLLQIVGVSRASTILQFFC
jgi:hypothetical protein